MEEDKGQYKKKHPAGTEADPKIAEAVKAKTTKEGIACTDATNVALTQGRSMSDVGRVIDLLEITIIKCQLGLFGYHPGRKIVKPMPSVDPKMEAAIKNRLSQGTLSCQAAWEIADSFGLPRMTVASACETLGIKIIACQLGAF